MAVEASALVSPLGRLQPAVLWPGLSDTKWKAKLAGFLTDAAVQVEGISDAAIADRATTAWAYYRAYGEVYERLVALPSTVAANDEGSASYLLTQITLMRDLRDQALADFTAIVGEDETVDAAPPSRPSSVSARNRFTW